MTDLYLTEPSEDYKDSYLEALREGFINGSSKPKSDQKIQEIAKNFPVWLETMVYRPGQMITCLDGVERARVPEQKYWLIDDKTFIGEVNLRYALNDFLEIYGGHIGYGIRPSRQRQGYGREILRLVLDKARDKQMSRVLVTCHPDNIASARIIEANGGVLENTLSPDWLNGGWISRYWIDL